MLQGFMMGVRRIFMDLRLISVVMCVWLVMVILIMLEIGVFGNERFMSFGPRPGLMFMHVAVDTPYKYTILVCMIVLHTFVSDFIADSLSPHIINTLQDMRCRYIAHKPHVYYAITTMWSIYCAISQLFLIFLALGQLDLLLVRLGSDLAANLLTTSFYLDGKIYDPRQFEVVMDDLPPTMLQKREEEEKVTCASCTA